MSLGGQAIRLAALFTAKRAFTHEVAETRRAEHRLVSSGIYAYMRHPGYMGWFWWSIGTQILLGNPICTLGFAYAGYLFFSDRIRFEEEKLVEFFGDEYVRYRARTPTLIPFIK